MRMRRNILSSVACPALQYFSKFSHKRQDFRGKKMLLNIKCEFWFCLQISSETFLILRRNEWDMITNVHWSSCKVPVILVRLLWNWNLLERFLKNNKISHFMKIRPAGAELLHAGGRMDRQKDMTKLIVALRNFAKAPKCLIHIVITTRHIWLWHWWNQAGYDGLDL